MSDQKLLNKEELLKLLKTNKKSESKRQDSDVPAFLRHFNILPGTEYVNPLVLYFLYKKWSYKKLTFVKFKVIIRRYIDTSPKGLFYNPDEAKFTSKDLYDATKEQFQEHREEALKKEKKPLKHKPSSPH